MQYREADPYVLNVFNYQLAVTKNDVKEFELTGDEKLEFIGERLIYTLSAVENAMEQFAQLFPDDSRNGWYLDLAEEIGSLTMSIALMDDYQLEYLYEVHDPETSTDLWGNVYAAEREKKPGKTIKKKVAKKKN